MEKLKIAIAGATGFVGKNLIEKIKTDFDIIALSRSDRKNEDNIEWRKTDLFSLTSTSNSLKDADVAIYLVHSMMPSTRLFQGDFEDTDLLLADNFARAAKENNIKQIIYLGGIVPEGHISEHLKSRNEVEGVLRSSGVPVTVLRAGMVVGNGGSSFEILRHLVLNLPIMVLPQWTQNRTQVIYISDLIRVISNMIDNEDFKNSTLNVVTGEDLNYRDLIIQMASKLNKSPLLLSVPVTSIEFSKLWVTIFGQSSYELVSPLLDSLLCDLPVSNSDPRVSKLIEHKTFYSMLGKFNLSEEKIPRKQRAVQQENSVRSVQRLGNEINANCGEIADEYLNWLPHYMKTIVHVKENKQDENIISFNLPMIESPLLILQYIPSDIEEDRRKFHIVGGVLSRTTNTGWLEFRQVDHKKYTLAAIHEFIPALPWYVYRFSQALAHKWVMNAFSKHLKEKLNNK
ncbi:NADH(P)-binding protein, PF13460 family [Bacteriovorax sp. BSW11_IV]|uniref:NAD(P)H-binding protein n=1 Tax=Bacteriovorax sp. BSW11_IV TaxID=1353529 RepID=UPI00038A371E|nr:NAD(P)H-binding protein [Bacteriovorax sp. BSW11_IV]EQC42985.1 NADH(P)-binding protein, PF13460 family [Bacteriovorax sp. BSW11_IV]